ncbi:MAG: UDP-N-acetylmuramoyl-L-alanyl-D-glutamate--2,6-diaminopimelate ligase [Thiotrichales bacterium]
MNSQAGPKSQMRLSELLRGIVEVPVSVDRPVHGLAIDSRDVRPGTLFFATRGTQRHGIEFAHAAVAAGATAVLWEPDPELAPLLDALAVPVIAVADLGQRVGAIAECFHGSPSRHLQVLGVTGTNGKTSVAHFLAQMLDQPPLRCGFIGTLGSGLFGELAPGTHTTPDAIQVHRILADFVTRGAACAAMEVSSHALDQGRVNGVRFEIGIFTNLSRDHLDYHGDMARYAAAKRRFFLHHRPRFAVLNADDEVGRQWLEALPSVVEPLAYSLHRPAAGVPTLVASDLRLTGQGMQFEVESPWGQAHIAAPLLGAFNASNLLASLGALLLLGVTLPEAVTRLSHLRPPPGRMECLGGGELPLVAIDYAHTPDALEKTLQTLRAHTSGRLTCVFGCGGDRDAGKRPLMGQAVEQYADHGIITDDNPRSEDPAAIVAAIRQGQHAARRMPVIHDRRSAIRSALGAATVGDVVLIAGKGNEDYQIVGRERRVFSDRAVVLEWLAEVSQ